MINDEDFVQLSADCIHVCDVLRSGIKGRDAECLAESAKSDFGTVSSERERYREPILTCNKDYERYRANSQETRRTKLAVASIPCQARQGEDPKVEIGSTKGTGYFQRECFP